MIFYILMRQNKRDWWQLYIQDVYANEAVAKECLKAFNTNDDRHWYYIDDREVI
jgi:hypothetical protein